MGFKPPSGAAPTVSVSVSSTIHAGGDIDTDANLKFKSGTAYTMTLDHGLASTDRTIILPDAAGTVALTTDIPAGAGLLSKTGIIIRPTTAGDVLAVTEDVISPQGLTATTTGIKVGAAGTVTVMTGNATAALFDAAETLTVTNKIQWKDDTAILGILAHANTSSDKTYTFPDVSGTVALTSQSPGSFGLVIDGGGSVITTGIKAYLVMPYSMTATEWTLIADVSGSIVIDLYKDTYANHPPLVGDTVTGSEKPTLSTAIKNQDTSLSTPIVITAGDIIGFNVDSATTVTKVALLYKGTRS